MGDSFGKETLLGIGIIFVTIIFQIIILLSTQILVDEMGLDVIKFFATSQFIVLILQVIALKYIYDDVKNFSESLESNNRHQVLISNPGNHLAASAPQGHPDPPPGYKRFK
tara:strand:- start:113 stop:445 length:333 start_codon:yes stop_codon:yes gene_type:complete